MADMQTFIFDDFRCDLLDMSLWQGKERVALTPKAFAVLRYLVQHPTHLVTKEDLFTAIWPDTIVSDATLTSCVKEIRRVLGDHSRAPRFIETVHKRGFRFIAEVVSSQYPVVSSQHPEFGTSSSLTQDSGLRTQHSVLVGREAELAQLHQWLESALHGEQQLVFVTGDPGIGKTTLVEAFLSGIRQRATGNEEEENQKAKVEDPTPNTQHPIPRVWLGWGQCVEHYGTGEPYLPVLDALGRLCRAPAGERIVAVLERCAPTWLAQLPALLSAEERERLQRQLVGSSRERMLREMADALEALSTERPLVLVLEDLQWSDHATIDLLSFLARRRPPARLLLLGVYRPVDVIVGDHPLKSLKQDLQAHGQCAELSLGFLTPDDVASYLTERFPVCPFSSDLAEVIHRRTDGNPLFMVNVVDYIRQQRLVVEHNGQWLLQGDVVEIETGVPENLRAMIAQQIDRLSHDEQRLLEAASAVGVRFSLAELAAALDKGAAEIEEQCERFARQGRFLRALGLRDWPDGAVAACYEFAHTIYQSMLHERLSLPQRMRLHQRIGDWIARAYGDRAAEVAAELAMHFEQGREYSRAIAALHQAAESAVRRCANREAASSLTKALTLLATLPDTPERARQELTLYTALGPILIASKGNAAPEVEQVYKRARDLCQQVGDTAQLFPIVFGLRSFYMMWGEIGFAHALGQELLQIAQKTDTPEFLLEAHVALASTYFFLGEFPACREHAEHGIALYQPRQHGAHVSLYGLDPGVFCLCRAGQVLWMLGRPEQGRERVFAALALARKLMHPYSLTFALLNTAWVLLFCRQGEKARAYVDEGLALANEHDFPFFLVWGSILRGWALTLQGRGKEGVAHIQQGLATPTPMADATRSYLLTLLAEACLSHGAPQEGLDVLAQVAETEQRSGERFLEAERCRLRGELLLQLAAPRRKMKVSRKPRGA